MLRSSTALLDALEDPSRRWQRQLSLVGSSNEQKDAISVASMTPARMTFSPGRCTEESLTGGGSPVIAARPPRTPAHRRSREEQHDSRLGSNKRPYRLDVSR